MSPPSADAASEDRWRFPRGAGGLSPEIVGEMQRVASTTPLVAALREGRAGPGAREQPPLTEEMLLAALAWRIGAALEDDEALVPLAPSLLEFTLAPYLGREAARERSRA